MMFGVPVSDLLLLAAVIVAGGVVAGFLAGLFGIGGGGILVPVLYEIFGVFGTPESVRMQLCVGTSLAIIVPTALRAYRSHRARGTLPVHILRIWAGPIAAGVIVGGAIAAFAPGWVFRLAFVLVAGLIALKLLFGRQSWRLGEHMPGLALMAVYGFAIGLSAALMGVGGGSLATLIMTLYGESIHVAVAISAGVGVLIALVGTIGYALAGWPHLAQLPPLSIGFVSLIGLFLLAPISSLAAPYGARLAHALPKRRLEIAFGCFLLLIAARFLVTLIW